LWWPLVPLHAVFTDVPLTRATAGAVDSSDRTTPSPRVEATSAATTPRFRLNKRFKSVQLPGPDPRFRVMRRAAALARPDRGDIDG